MSVTGPSGRMLELLSLLQNGRSWPAGELAERLGTPSRTLRRDIDRLRELGYPVASGRGPGGGYQLVAGRAMPPLLLTDDEAVATVMGLRFAALARVDGATGAADRALRKLERVLPARLRHRIGAVAAATEAVSRAGPRLDLRVLESLGTAAHGRLHVGFGYTGRSGRRSERRVEPYRLFLLDRNWYLLGWDRDRADWRTFRVDRIEGLDVRGTTFRPRRPPEGDPVSFVLGGTASPDPRHHGVVRFEAPLAVVADRLRAEAGSLEALGDSACRYVTAAESWEWLAGVLAAVGVAYTVEGPPELVARTRELARRAAGAAGEAHRTKGG